VVVPGSAAAEKVLPRLASSLAQVLAQRRAIAAEVEGILDAHPLAKVLTSMPGVGVRTAARLLLEVGDGSAFPTAGHLAAYAGLAPVTRRSGTSIRGERPPRGGNKQLKRALFLSAFAALADPTSRAYYDRKRAAGNATTPPSSAWPAAGSTSSTRCSATAPSTKPNLPKRLDRTHRDTSRGRPATHRPAAVRPRTGFVTSAKFHREQPREGHDARRRASLGKWRSRLVTATGG